MSFFPSAYDASEATKESIRQAFPFHTILLHQDARALTQWVRENFPGTFIIHRIWVDDEMDGWLNGGGQYWRGRELAQRIYTENAGADAYISLNEPPIGGDTEFQRKTAAEDLAMFDAGFIDQMYTFNKVALVGGFSSGTPEEDAFHAYLQELILSITSPLMDNWVMDNWALHFHAYGPNRNDDRDAENDLMATHAHDNALRVTERLRPALGYLPPTFFTETGPCGYNPGQELGWIGYHDEAVVIEDSEQWAAQVVNFQEVLGFTDFCDGDSGDWWRFNNNGTGLPNARSQWNENHARVLVYSDGMKNEIARIHGVFREKCPDFFPTVAVPPVPQTGEPQFDDDAAMIRYLTERFSPDEWLNAGGLLDNWGVWLARVGKLPINEQEWLDWALAKALRRKESADIDYANLLNQSLNLKNEGHL